MFCAYHGHPKVAQALIDAGCDIHAQGSVSLLLSFCVSLYVFDLLNCQPKGWVVSHCLSRKIFEISVSLVKTVQHYISQQNFTM